MPPHNNYMVIIEQIETNSSAQRRRAKSGRDFENRVFNDLTIGIGTDAKIQLLRPRTQVYPPGVKRQHTFACLQIKTNFGEIIVDSDIVAWKPKTQKPVALISCKTSVRERLMQSIGNREMYRKGNEYNPALYFVTLDNDLEFGTTRKPKKYRIVASYMDVNVYSLNPLTEFSGCIYPYDQMITDLKRISGMKP